MRESAERPLRLFVALLVPAEVIAVAEEVQAALRSKQLAVRWVRPAGIHLTLQFLGETPAERVPALEEALARVAAIGVPLRLYTVGVGCFPTAEARTRVVWLGLAGEDERLAALQAAVIQATSLLGYEPEARPFAPHLTLGRVRDDATPGERAHVGRVVRALPPPDPAPWRVDDVALMLSVLGRDGATYRPLGRWRLGSGEPVEPAEAEGAGH